MDDLVTFSSALGTPLRTVAVAYGAVHLPIFAFNVPTDLVRSWAYLRRLQEQQK